MRSALLVLAMPRCRDASRNATLGVVESLLDLEGGLGYNIIMGHVDQLLESLRLIALTAWATPVSHSVPFIPTGTSSPPLHTTYLQGCAASGLHSLMQLAVAAVRCCYCGGPLVYSHYCTCTTMLTLLVSRDCMHTSVRTHYCTNLILNAMIFSVSRKGGSLP